MSSVLAAIFSTVLEVASPIPTQVRYVELHGLDAEPYATLGAREWKRTNIVISNEDLDKIHREVYGQPLEWIPPRMPGWGGPYVYRDLANGRILTDFYIGAMGYFEAAFLPANPPSLSQTYFTSFDHAARLPDIVALHRFSAQRLARRLAREDLQRFPVK